MQPPPPPPPPFAGTRNGTRNGNGNGNNQPRDSTTNRSNAHASSYFQHQHQPPPPPSSSFPNQQQFNQQQYTPFPPQQYNVNANVNANQHQTQYYGQVSSPPPNHPHPPHSNSLPFQPPPPPALGAPVPVQVPIPVSTNIHMNNPLANRAYLNPFPPPPNMNMNMNMTQTNNIPPPPPPRPTSTPTHAYTQHQHQQPNHQTQKTQTMQIPQIQEPFTHPQNQNNPSEQQQQQQHHQQQKIQIPVIVPNPATIYKPKQSINTMNMIPPPTSNSRYVVQDDGNASPNIIRGLSFYVPRDKDILSQCFAGISTSSGSSSGGSVHDYDDRGLFGLTCMPQSVLSRDLVNYHPIVKQIQKMKIQKMDTDNNNTDQQQQQQQQQQKVENHVVERIPVVQSIPTPEPIGPVPVGVGPKSSSYYYNGTVDPIRCTVCDAYINPFTFILQDDGSTLHFRCNFCSRKNKITLTQEQQQQYQYQQEEKVNTTCFKYGSVEYIVGGKYLSNRQQEQIEDLFEHQPHHNKHHTHTHPNNNRHSSSMSTMGSYYELKPIVHLFAIDANDEFKLQHYVQTLSNVTKDMMNYWDQQRTYQCGSSSSNTNRNHNRNHNQQSYQHEQSYQRQPNQHQHQHHHQQNQFVYQKILQMLHLTQPLQKFPTEHSSTVQNSK
mmetsp:Transcript_23444/g.26719  ORF Transcript_23444/g.26719 Transcript_23444/m.26719 type:complete len:659 (-) Transcript_23444:1140-3116(-)